MSTSPDDRNPYPPADFERRLAKMEGWRGTVEEWRRSVDEWRRVIDREGLVTALAVQGTKLDQINRENSSQSNKLAHIETKVDALEEDRSQRRGVVLTGKVAAAFIASAAALGTIIALLVALLAGGGGA